MKRSLWITWYLFCFFSPVEAELWDPYLYLVFRGPLWTRRHLFGTFPWIRIVPCSPRVSTGSTLTLVIRRPKRCRRRCSFEAEVYVVCRWQFRNLASASWCLFIPGKPSVPFLFRQLDCWVLAELQLIEMNEPQRRAFSRYYFHGHLRVLSGMPPAYFPPENKALVEPYLGGIGAW